MPTSERLKTVILTTFTGPDGTLKGCLELQTNQGLREYPDKDGAVCSLRNNAVLLSRKHDVPLFIINGDLIRQVLVAKNQPPKP